MGNVLESDTSSLSDNDNEETLLAGETRTQGDGMESEIAVVANGPDVNHSAAKNVTPIVKLPVVFQDVTAVAPQVASNSVPNLKSSVLNAIPYQRFTLPDRESPKQLPPRDKLIVLKPAKLPDKPVDQNSNNAYNKLASAPTKQREPKFVPYEPYKGATRSMTEDDSIKSHSRKPSLGSSNSSGSIKLSKAEMPQVNHVPISNASFASENGPQKCCSQIHPERDISSKHGHSEILLKERLKIYEKDINELRTENTRLKKMLVDSLSGFGSPPSGDISQRSFRIDTRNSSMSESVDNLSDEIEVWRSKFLSSCVLVEQLTKENQDWKCKVNSAVELFRETKQAADVVLTPVLFDKINAWLQQSRDPRRSSELELPSFYQDHDISNSDPPTS